MIAPALTRTYGLAGALALGATLMGLWSKAPGPPEEVLVQTITFTTPLEIRGKLPARSALPGEVPPDCLRGSAAQAATHAAAQALRNARARAALAELSSLGPPPAAVEDAEKP